MNKPDPRAFEEKLLTIDLIDGLRREQERFDLALSDADRMKTLRSEIQSYYAQAGITVSDELIDKAIAERQQQRYAFRPPRLGIAGRLVASCYVYRGRLTAVVGSLAAFALFLWLAERQVARWELAKELDAYRSGLEQQLRDIGELNATINALPAQLPTLSAEQVPALPQWMLELTSTFQQSQTALREWQQCRQLSLPADLTLAWPGETQLESCHAQLPNVEQAAVRAQQSVTDQRQLASAVTNHVALQQRLTANPALLEWRAISVPNSAAVAAAGAAGNRQQFIEAVGNTGAAVDALGALDGTHQQASNCLSIAVAQASAADSVTLNGLLNEGASFKQSTSTNGVAQWTARATDTCEFFSTPISLRIVNERGADTGVWRYYDGNRNARTYYIIVDAVMTGGGNVDAVFESVEDQRAYTQHRFGVRVSERVFDAIRQDKQDDGLLRDNTIGEKPANSLQFELDEGFERSFIAEW